MEMGMEKRLIQLIRIAGSRTLTPAEVDEADAIATVKHRRERVLEKALKQVQSTCFEVTNPQHPNVRDTRASTMPTRAFDIDETPTSLSGMRGVG